MVDISFKMHLTLDMAYIIVRMHLALHVPLGTLIMAYILIKMHLASHVHFRTLAMTYIFVKMHLALHVLFRTLAMSYIPFKTCLTLAMVNNFIIMHCAYNNIFDVFIKPHTKVHCALQIMENQFHYNPT
jgi:hypothetical protein